MGQLVIEVPHSLDREEAMRRLKDKFASAMAEQGDRVNQVRHEWNGHTLTFAFQALGMAVSGTVAVEQKVVKFVAELPFAALLFKRTIEERLRQEAGALLAQ
jgi:hypothetical protein